MDSTTYRKGDRVQVTGDRRTTWWPRYLQGTVEETRGVYVYVRWDNAKFTSDEMTTDEVKKVQDVS